MEKKRCKNCKHARDAHFSRYKAFAAINCHNIFCSCPKYEEEK